VDPDVAKLLAFVASCETGLSFVYFNLYDNVMEVDKGEDSL